MNTVEIKKERDQLKLIGELTRKTVVKSFEKQSIRLLTRDISLIDLSQVIKSDTAGLAWLLLMLEKANNKAIPIKFVNIPQELAKLAKLSAVDSFLPVE